jgi:CO/xanthine dehydrogenase Mo-binding subunit
MRRKKHGRTDHDAIIKRIDTSKAEKIDGVKAILTWETVPDWKYGKSPYLSRVESQGAE